VKTWISLTAGAGTGLAVAAAASIAMSWYHARPVASSRSLPDAATIDKLHEDAQAKLAARFNVEPTDPDWAATSEDQIRAAVQGRGERLAREVTAVACKRSMCRMSLVWPSRVVAKQELQAWARTSYGPNCVKSLVLPTADDGSGKYTADLYMFNCHGRPETEVSL
jgi:hypothetical protein